MGGGAGAGACAGVFENEALQVHGRTLPRSKAAHWASLRRTSSLEFMVDSQSEEPSFLVEARTSNSLDKNPVKTPARKSSWRRPTRAWRNASGWKSPPKVARSEGVLGAVDVFEPGSPYVGHFRV